MRHNSHTMKVNMSRLKLQQEQAVKKSRPRQFEDELCINCIAELTLARPINALIYHNPNGGDRGKYGAIVGGKLKKMGTRPGVWDYLVIIEGAKFVYLEAKLEKRKFGKRLIHEKSYLSKDQKVFREEVTALCGEAVEFHEFRSVKEFFQTLDSIGVRFKLRKRVQNMGVSDGE